MAITKEELLARRIGDTEDVPVPGVGTVTVRGLSRAEVMSVRKATDSADTLDGPRALVIERKMLAAAMVDPVMTEAEVGAWQACSAAGEMDVVVNKVQEMSAMTEGADKSSVRGIREQP
jgi:hypothetical protein